MPGTDRPRILVKIYSDGDGQGEIRDEDGQGVIRDEDVIINWFARHYQLMPDLDIKTKIVENVLEDVLPDLDILGRTDCKIAKRYDFFFFVFLMTKTDGRLMANEQNDPGVSLDEILNVVKSKEGLTCNPKIFLIQADDNSLLEDPEDRTETDGPSELIEKKIPQDVDILIIECNIPRSIYSTRRHISPSRSVMLQAFMDEMGEKRDSLTTDLLSRTTYILDKVEKELKNLAMEHVDITNLPLPIVTSTLTKLVLL